MRRTQEQQLSSSLLEPVRGAEEVWQQPVLQVAQNPSLKPGGPSGGPRAGKCRKRSALRWYWGSRVGRLTGLCSRTHHRQYKLDTTYLCSDKVFLAAGVPVKESQAAAVAPPCQASDQGCKRDAGAQVRVQPRVVCSRACCIRYVIRPYHAGPTHLPHLPASAKQYFCVQLTGRDHS